MESWIVLGIIFIFAAYFFGRVGYAIENDKNKKSDYEKKNEAVNDAINKEENQTRNLLIKTLADIGCQYEINDENSICFKYQGEEFKIDASNDSHIIWIYDVAWGGININDPDADYLKQAVNKANESSAITNLYTINKKKGFIATHCQMVTYFACNIPNYNEYLKSILDGFFIAQKQVRDEFANLCKNQEQKNRIEIKGFR
ncbi:hypothetical protein AB9N12_18030 [Bacteroides sp. AN502(2024)]|uniref:hypothetical protein n=1 Tax=Bacteroides sp. AN502(2024) TaxID=3160599 RepID=UPI0035187E02